MEQNRHLDYQEDIHPINPSLLKTTSIDTQQDLRPPQMKLRQPLKEKNPSFSETKGRKLDLPLNSLNLLFTTN